LEQEVAVQLLAQMAEIQSSINGPSTGWFTLAAAVIGFIAAMLSTVLVEYLRRKHEKKTLRASLVAEVTGVAEIIRARQYIDGLQAGAEGRLTEFPLNVPNDYFPVYKANTAKLGLLTPQEATLIVRFYNLIESVIQDVIPGGMLSSGQAGQEGFKQDAEFLERALHIADELASGRSANQGAK
tara:strand:+ start:34384 stop:34932 length:549 start_codon:yes stop_codon:yes gene_type:complete